VRIQKLVLPGLAAIARMQDKIFPDDPQMAGSVAEYT
jgi:hypothetical protein